MKTANQVTTQKLRGGFYTPAPLADFCLDRVRDLSRGLQLRRWLEPSSGDGGFVRRLGCARDLQAEVEELTCVELLTPEAEKCAAAIRDAKIAGTVHNESFFGWAQTHRQPYDALVGNPPFVRFQFFHPSDRDAAAELASAAGVRLRRVANVWIPFAIAAIDRLRIGGVFALVLPSELVSTVSAGDFRRFILSVCDDIQLDLFGREAFPGILQDVAVLSGTKVVGSTSLGRRPSSQPKDIHLRCHSGSTRSWSHSVPVSDGKWTKYLLSGSQLEALDTAAQLESTVRLGTIAKLQVATVTGANQFFTLTDETRKKYQLDEWCAPLLPKTSEFDGILFTRADHDTMGPTARRWMLNFSEDRPNPMEHRGARTLLEEGQAQGLPLRYKCRIRNPWYRVPVVSPGDLLMTKRSHFHHRLLRNKAGVVTTDTIYQGRLIGSARAEDVVSCFHSSLTMLSCELEGRTYGGGVLELVPSEIAELSLPLVSTDALAVQLDKESRASGGQKDDSFLMSTLADRAIAAKDPAYGDIVMELRSAWEYLRQRRLD